MKKANTLKALVLASVPMISAAYGQETPNLVPGSVSPVTFALTLTSETAAVAKKTTDGKPVKGEFVVEQEYTVGNTTTFEQGTKAVATKYSNKELLLDLQALEILPEGDLKGWTIQKVQATLPDGELLKLGPVKFYAVKGTVVKPLVDALALSLVARVDTGSIKIVSKTTGSGENTKTTTTSTHTGNLKQARSLELKVSENETYYLSGIYTGTQKLGATKTKVPVILSGAGKIAALNGFVDENTVIEGSLTLGAGVANPDVVGFFGGDVLVDDEDVNLPE